MRIFTLVAAALSAAFLTAPALSQNDAPPPQRAQHRSADTDQQLRGHQRSDRPMPQRRDRAMRGDSSPHDRQIQGTQRRDGQRFDARGSRDGQAQRRLADGRGLRGRDGAQRPHRPLRRFLMMKRLQQLRGSFDGGGPTCGPRSMMRDGQGSGAPKRHFMKQRQRFENVPRGLPMPGRFGQQRGR